MSVKTRGRARKKSEGLAFGERTAFLETSSNAIIVFRQERKKDSLFGKGSRKFKIMAKIQYLGKPKT